MDSIPSSRGMFLGRPCEGLQDLIRLLREADAAAREGGTVAPYDPGDLPTWGGIPGARRLSRTRGKVLSWGPEGVLVHYGDCAPGGWGIEYV